MTKTEHRAIAMYRESFLAFIAMGCDWTCPRRTEAQWRTSGIDLHGVQCII